MVPADGSGVSGIMAIGDSPWRDEVAAGRNFAGAAGHVYNRWLSLIGMDRADLTTTNVMWEPPPHLGWSDKWARRPSSNPECAAAVDRWRPALDALIAERAPKVIVPMGAVALRRICNLTGIDDLVNYVIDTPYGIPAVATYHPSYVMQGNHKLTPSVLFAFKRAQEIANGNYQESRYELHLDPPVQDIHSYIRSGCDERGRIHSLFVDIETPESGKLDEEDVEGAGSSFTIIRVGFSVRSGSAVTFPWLPEYRGPMQEALDRSDEFAEWADNRFDSRRLGAAGLTLPTRVVSGMWAWHWLQSDLRKGLGKVAPFWYAGPPWKHLNAADPARYNCLAGTTMIPLWDGAAKLPIGEIVRNKVPIRIIGVNTKGEAIPVRVVDWHRKGRPSGTSHDWLKIDTESFKQSILCTDDHKVYTPHGEKRADELVSGDLIISSHYGNESMIHGTILGDGHVDYRGRLSFGHSISQKEWFYRKHYNVRGTKPVFSAGGYGGETINTDAWIGKRWRKLFYDRQGKKLFVPPPSIESMAVWYCDDGCLASSRNARFAAHGFVNQDALLKWFEKEFGTHSFGIYNIVRSGFVVGLNVESTKVFHDLIAPFVPPEMQYKLIREQRGKYNGWLEVPRFQYAMVTKVKRRRIWGAEYCVTVDDPTHRFMTDGGLVKNCLDVAIGRAAYEGSKLALMAS